MSAGMAETTGPGVVLAGAFDTKHEEYGYVRDRLARAGVKSTLVDFGVQGVPGIRPDVGTEAVARAGGSDIDALVRDGDRNAAMIVMGRGAAAEIRRLHERGDVAGVMVLGGSNAGYAMSRIAEALPFGCPKLLVSTIVAGDTRPYVGTSDLTMMYPVVDIAGLNSISMPVLAHAADAMAGMVTAPPLEGSSDVRSIGASMFGVTTPCVDAVRSALEGDGHEVHVFHGNGTGGRSLEAMIRSGVFAAVADITTSELADELLGGVCSAGPRRLEAAAETGTPQVVSVGALDMVNFGSPDTVPERFAGRLLHAHNPAITLMRTNAGECAELGGIIADKLNAARGFTEVVIPSRGFSQISVEGAPFHDPEADAALIDALRSRLDPRIPLSILDLTINDPRFADEITQSLGRALSLTKGTHS